MPKPPDGKAARPVPKDPRCGLRGIASLVHYRRLAPGKPGRPAQEREKRIVPDNPGRTARNIPRSGDGAIVQRQ